LVSWGDPQISPSPARGPSRVVLPAVAWPDFAVVLPGGHRQGAGAPILEYPRCPGSRTDSRLGFRDRPWDTPNLSVRSHHQPNRRRSRRAPLSPLAGTADGLLPGTPRRRLGGAGA